MKTAKARIALGVLLIGGVLAAQDGPRGHWTGSIDVPGQSLDVEVDLDKTANGWTGSITIPAQHASGLPLEAIGVEKDKCTFRIKGAPGEPTFTGTLSADGKTLPGDFTQGGQSFPFKLERAGEPKAEPSQTSPAVRENSWGRGRAQSRRPVSRCGWSSG